MRYPFNLWWSEDDQRWIAEVYDLPGCLADGETPEQAAREAAKTARLWLEVAREEGREIPTPSSQQQASGQLALRLPKFLHASLRRRAAREGVSLNQYLVAALSERDGEARGRETATHPKRAAVRAR